MSCNRVSVPMAMCVQNSGDSAWVPFRFPRIWVISLHNLESNTKPAFLSMERLFSYSFWKITQKFIQISILSLTTSLAEGFGQEIAAALINSLPVLYNNFGFFNWSGNFLVSWFGGTFAISPPKVYLTSNFQYYTNLNGPGSDTNLVTMIWVFLFGFMGDFSLNSTILDV